MVKKQTISGLVGNEHSYKIAGRCLAIAAFVLLFCSCISFNIADWPSRFTYPHNAPPKNWCGPIGALLAYYLMYYVGPGIFIILISAIVFFIAKLANRAIDQPVLRTIGLVLVTAAASVSFFCIWPHAVYTFPFGSGGILGVAAAHFLKNRFAALGTFLLVTSTWVVGVILLADSFALTLAKASGAVLLKIIEIIVPAWAAAKNRSRVLNEIWQKLSEKQKLLPALVPQPDLSTGAADVPFQIAAQTAPVNRVSDLAVILPKMKKPAKPAVPASYDDYVLPPLELLAEPEHTFADIQEKVVKAKAAALEKLLGEFNITARVVAADTGPVVTMFELELAAGIKVSQIAALANDMARALGVGAVRVVAPLPGKHTIGIEVPNSEKERVRMKDIIQLAAEKHKDMEIPLFLGKDTAGEALISDLTDMPHLLIAGTTGSGKSVCINSIICSILLTKHPDDVKLILIDPKMVEMTAFNTIPHLMSPIVTETQRAVQILEWATVKMDERYALFAEARVKNIAEYNCLGLDEIRARFNPTSADEEEKIPKKLPYIVIIIDELADLMMTAPKEIEAFIVRLAQKSRAIGIHIVLATQRPQATVVTGLIKSNMPTRIGFRVAARLDSRIVLDQNGAEALLGQGDMLFLQPGTSELVRAQGTFVDETEVRRITKHLKDLAEPHFHPELTQLSSFDPSEMTRDDLFDEAARIILESQRGSVSLLQRRLGIGYARASRIIEMMAAAGVLGEYKGSQAREVLMTLKEYEQLRKQMEKDAEAGYKDLAEDQDAPPSPPTEGQHGYVSVDKEAD